MEKIFLFMTISDKKCLVLSTMIVMLMMSFPQVVYLSIAEHDPGGAGQISPDQNVTSDLSNSSTTLPPVTNATIPTTTTEDLSYLENCPTQAPCEHLSGHCIECHMNHYCTYGSQPTANCTQKPGLKCTGNPVFNRSYYCRYCYQLDPALYTCTTSTNCNMKSAPRQKYYSTCKVKEDIICLGSRSFQKAATCNWTSGYKWSTALVLSITLGGFGVDRFYLGLWREGIGKLFSFGGLGVWTLVDVILIAVGYVGPYDGSLYIYPWD